MALDPRFQYETYERNQFATREELTAMAAILLDAKTGWMSIIWNSIRIAGLLALFIIREKMMKEEMLIGRQMYMRKRSAANRDELKDEFDGLPRTEKPVNPA